MSIEKITENTIEILIWEQLQKVVVMDKKDKLSQSKENKISNGYDTSDETY